MTIDLLSLAASELCILSGAEIAIIVHSLGKRVFSFGHPTPDSVIDRFLNGGAEGAEVAQNCATTKARDYNRHYSDVCQELEAEKKRMEVIEEAKRVEGYGGGGDGGFWWDKAVDGMELEEMEQYAAAMDELRKNVNMRADDLMLIQSSNSLPIAGPAASAALTLPNTAETASCTLDETAAFVNQNQLNNGFDYENCVVPYGFGQGQI
ncbi:hypothetical protein BUALT_Bualt19G0100200 [Buddleja alternifolia]|uniref:MADS-box domain-containing protein n=1 Tax=Buddleja alternifolia TaxID=168488 RepID=A0AAV6WB89_9LAMI|nr:hypothetical protein BUALT_Bualt19G0100200 [Buddleja alternifolia]